MKPCVPEHIASLIPYPPGKPMEELEREYGIRNSIKLASNENPWARRPKPWKPFVPPWTVSIVTRTQRILFEKALEREI